MRSFAIGGILYAIPSAVYSLVTADNFPGCPTIVRFSQHMFGTLMNTAVTNMPFMNMPDSDRVSYFAFYTLDTNIAAFLGMLFGTWFVGAFPDLMHLPALQIYRCLCGLNPSAGCSCRCCCFR